MGFIGTLSRALVLWGKENALDIIGTVLMPGTKRLVNATIGPQPSRWASTNLWAARTVDGGVIGGIVPPTAGAKYAIPKGLPKQGQRVLAVENEPHMADGFSGEITEGYGKGIKTLLADEKVAIKIGTKTLIGRMNYHIHDAERAGLHYDLVVESVPPGTKKWELNIPRGEYKGRYAFVTTKRGVIVVPMLDEGQVLAKPSYTLKPVEFLDKVAEEADQWIIEQKMDGSLVNVAVREGRGIFRSHRDTGETYYDRIPHLEDLSNHSRIFMLRRWMPAPRINGTILKGEAVHPDGHGRIGGIFNALPDKAQEIQRLRGKAEFWAWDIVLYKGRDVSVLPYRQRRQLLEKVVGEVRLYNRYWHLMPAMPKGGDPREFYRRIIAQPLPYGEGIVLKRADEPAGLIWFKIKDVDFTDLVCIEFREGTGKYQGSVGKILVENPGNGARGEVGSFAITDGQRDWIWQHRENLAGTVGKIRVQELTSRGAPRAGVFMGFHEGKGSEAGLMMYSESLAGGDQKQAQSTMYALKSAAGWSRA